MTHLPQSSVSTPISDVFRFGGWEFEDAPKLATIVAARTCPVTGEVISKIMSILGSVDGVHVRESRHGIRTSPIEELVFSLCEQLDIPCSVWAAKSSKPEALLARNRSMVANSTDVIAFFPDDRIFEGGTGILTQNAFERGLSVEAYSVSRSDGSISVVGFVDSTEPF